MAITTFTAAQVLTAAQMNAVQSNDFNQTVSTKTASYTLVAADKGTRIAMNSASATTITVNTSLFSASDTLVLQNIGAGVCTVTAGTATVSSAGALAIPQFGSGTLFFTSAGVSIFFPSAGAVSASGLTLITNVVLNSASTVLSNVFSATFENYLVQGSNISKVAAGEPNLTLRLGAGTAHAFNEIYYTPNSTGLVSSNAASGNVFNASQLGNSNDQNTFTAFFRSPFIAIKTGFTCHSSGYDDQMRFCMGVETSMTSFTSLTIACDGGQTVTGNLQVYGFAL